MKSHQTNKLIFFFSHKKFVKIFSKPIPLKCPLTFSLNKKVYVLVKLIFSQTNISLHKRHEGVYKY